MQYKIQGSPEQIQELAPLFFDYTYTVKNNLLTVLTDINDDSELFAFLSMVKRPVSVDYMTRDLIKFVVL